MKCPICEMEIQGDGLKIVTFMASNPATIRICSQCRSNPPSGTTFRSCSVCGIPLLHPISRSINIRVDHENLCLDYSNTSYCPECWDENVMHCIQCHRSHNRDIISECNCSGMHCIHCSCPENRSGVLNAHSRPKVKIHGESPYYGMELEIESLDDRNDVAREMQDSSRGFWCEEDGSLSDDHGLEVCFEPRSIISWKEYNSYLADIIDIAVAHGGTAYSSMNCGIHIHRNRDDLNDIHISKLLVAIVKLRPYIVTIAQRNSSEYASFDYYSNTTDTYTMFYKKLKDGVYNNERYVALNLQNHETIEFRIFRSTLKQSTIHAYLAFCDTLTSWVGGIGFPRLISQYRRVLWVDYVNYVMNTPHAFKKDYLDFMHRKKLLVLQDKKVKGNKKYKII